MKKGFKKAVRQIHLWLGLASGLIVLIISITGFLYVFEAEIRDAAQQEFLHVPVQQKPFIGLTAILENYQRLEPKQKITALKVNKEEANATVQISTKKKKTYYFNPYDGSLVNEKGADWLNTVLEVHRTLLLGEAGEFIQGWSVVIFLIMLITGLILWFPNQMRLVKQSLQIKWSGSFKRVNYDLHQVLGFYAAVVLLLIAFSGLYFKFDTAKKAVNVVTRTTLSKGTEAVPPAKIDSTTIPVRYNKIYESVNAQYPGASSISFSVRKTGELRVRMTYPNQWASARKQNSIFFDGKTGALVRTKLYKDNNAADVYEASNHDLHTGAFFGLAGKILWSVVSLIGASLPVTGFIIWWKKGKKSKGKKVKKGKG
ncbi:PepSY domain-containing protein [Flavobacterium sp. LC2016-23]|uniref:PepSY-associated TM helix domain-containing protein n=1 Tax=Flavobacterium sp. LC2016-23 TaxID=2666330 RepID=UPI0012B10227|nr:PepSY-associated TM helix domain-containing protein [Flavobacterium sp. LC2016-23]MRX41344.1 PepSY domain-containing protein [Flavobacterium sp. LC2016-23]